MSGSEPLAEDITQEVFLALIRDDCGFDPARGTLSGYLFGIARKLVLRHMERGRLDVTLDSDLEEAALPELAVDDDPLLDLTHREGLDALRRAVLALPRRYREVVVLCDLEEMDYADAAVALGCPIGTVRSRLHRARALLLEKLNQDRQRKAAVAVIEAGEVFCMNCQEFWNGEPHRSNICKNAAPARRVARHAAAGGRAAARLGAQMRRVEAPARVERRLVAAFRGQSELGGIRPRGGVVRWWARGRRRWRPPRCWRCCWSRPHQPATDAAG